MTVVLDSDPAFPETEADAAPDWRPAGWWARAGAFGIDVLAGMGVAATALLIGWSAPLRGWLWWLCMLIAAAAVVAIAANRWWLPSVTGWSLGRAVLGIAVVDRDGDQVGIGRLALRDLAHLADTAPLFLGWLWPLIDRRGRTFADMLVGTEVRDDPGLPDRRRLAGRVMAGAAALSVLTAALGLALIYRHQRAVDTARAQIAEQGPKIVVDMLSYTAKTVQEDFDKAQGLVTEAYRPELVKQQDAVRKNPVDNDYWVSNSAVLSAADKRASMLMLLQGQRGAAPTQRFVTASVRVDFERQGHDWRVSNLTVLSAPKPAPEAPQGEAPKGEPAKGESPKSPAPKPDSPKPSPSKPAPPTQPAPQTGKPGR